jgi:hypothetical protein
MKTRQCMPVTNNNHIWNNWLVKGYSGDVRKVHNQQQHELPILEHFSERKQRQLNWLCRDRKCKENKIVLELNFIAKSRSNLIK